MNASISRSSMEPGRDTISTVDLGKGSDNPRGEYEEYLELSREFTGKRLQKLVRKVDWHVLPQLIIIYLLSYIDRNNVGMGTLHVDTPRTSVLRRNHVHRSFSLTSLPTPGNAKLFGALPDMRMSGQDWNTGLAVFFVTYAAGGVPSNIALKRFGPRIWLPFLLFTVSLILISSSLQNNRAGWITFRVLLGWFEAGVFPGCSFILTIWYSPAEIHTRLSIFFCGASAAGAFSGLLAYGIGHLDHTWGFRGWRWIYCLEGLFSLLIAIGAWFLINDTPAKVTNWLSPEERRFLILRHRFAAGGETGIAEKEEFSWKAAREAFTVRTAYKTERSTLLTQGVLDGYSLFTSMPCKVTIVIELFAANITCNSAATEFTLCVAVYGYAFILPTIIFNLGYTAAEAQAMTAPPYIFACMITLFSGWAADRWRQRMLSVLLPNLLAVFGFIVMIITSRYPNLPGVTLTAWIALNCAGSMKRAVGMGAMISFSQLGGIVGSNIYIAAQSPTYPVGFGISLGMLSVFGVIWPVVYWLILKRINARRAAIPLEEIHARYTDQELSEMGDRSPLFRYST
ncbi:putative pantothenate transporter [Colletotrichum karsti]|uniref:Pantothenate transporter n=1 Tax=Colletotrichum karsti TaxID=1095194 RepID=A0A9P6I3U5_9PEZI|nr:putative pantothenate transporter [Colletotrichum karsti]KAF9873486.1 putative pantothenate transporter [Colletotrichum karsti]